MSIYDLPVIETRISHVNGHAGELTYRGQSIEALAGVRRFEDVIDLLWQNLTFGTSADLGPARAQAFDVYCKSVSLPSEVTIIDGLKILFSSLPAKLHDPVLVTAAFPVFLAGLARRKRGLASVAPDPRAGHVADFLRCWSGVSPSVDHVRALEAYLVTVADHGMNASTFVARIVASTRAGLPAAVIAALCALSGPLHGGAPGPVLSMLDAIGVPANIAVWTRAALEKNERIMGFGHRIYRTRDPRAEILRSIVRQLQSPRIDFAEQAEKEIRQILAEAKPKQSLPTNVEFYTALLLDALGFTRDLFTGIFALGRVAGWTAHVIEQEKFGRLIRPEARYIGV